MKRKIYPSVACMVWSVGVLMMSTVTGQPETLPARQDGDSQRYAHRNAQDHGLEIQVHRLVNTHRARRGLAPLDYNDDIAAIARQHSVAMATGRSDFSHNGANERQRVIARRIRLRRFAENIAMNTFPAHQTSHEAMVDWLSSPGHRAAIEGNFNTTGIGVARDSRGGFFFTQIFLLTKE